MRVIQDESANAESKQGITVSPWELFQASN